jgi:hypothetical protein
VEAPRQGRAKDDKDKDKDKKDDVAAAQSQHVLRIISMPAGAEVVVDGASVERPRSWKPDRSCVAPRHHAEEGRDRTTST